jgi:hypothetical protein
VVDPRTSRRDGRHGRPHVGRLPWSPTETAADAGQACWQRRRRYPLPPQRPQPVWASSPSHWSPHSQMTASPCRRSRGPPAPAPLTVHSLRSCQRAQRRGDGVQGGSSVRRSRDAAAVTGRGGHPADRAAGGLRSQDRPPLQRGRVGLGLVRNGGEEQLTDVFIGLVVEAVRPQHSDGHGGAWRLLGDVADSNLVQVYAVNPLPLIDTGPPTTRLRRAGTGHRTDISAASARRTPIERRSVPHWRCLPASPTTARTRRSESWRSALCHDLMATRGVRRA